MVEVKLSQGAKPGHGGILLADKVSQEIAEICGIPPRKDSICPAAHTEFTTPVALLEFIARLRELSAGKPVGFKLCLGRRSEFLGICKAMVRTGIAPDFITVDGAEGGAGAAPSEFANHIGTPLLEALDFVHMALRGIGFREQVRLIASGRISSGFDMVVAMAMGADICAAARSFMIAMGCMQSLKCDRNSCPTGIATQNRWLAYGIEPGEKSQRVADFHRQTLASCREIMSSMGVSSARSLTRAHVLRLTMDGVRRPLEQISETIMPGDLRSGKIPASLIADWSLAHEERF